MLLLLHKTLKDTRNIQGFALIRAVLFTFYFDITRPNCILWIVSGFRNKDAPFLLPFFQYLWAFRQNFNMFEVLSLKSKKIQTQNWAPI